MHNENSLGYIPFGHKTSLNNLKTTEIYPASFPITMVGNEVIRKLGEKNHMEAKHATKPMGEIKYKEI